jgi:hypothetical protein
MKKLLLIGGIILLAQASYSQNHIKCSGFHDAIGNIANKYSVESVGSQTKQKQVNGPLQNPDITDLEQSSSSSSSTINWKLIGGTNNIYGSLYSGSKPLQYNASLNAVSFVHRKSFSYQAIPMLAPTATNGVIVAEVSTDMGVTFDSTCIFQDATNWGNSPQGAIYNPIGNTTIANAYIVGCGPTNNSGGYTGNWYASKKLNSFNASPDVTPNAQQVIASNATSYNAGMGPIGLNRIGFTSTDDGVVRSLGCIADDAIALTGLRGYAITKGTFNAGSFIWTRDSIIPNLVVTSSGKKQMGNAQMAWNQSGTVGYIVILGPAATATNSNRGFQPNVYKTTNSGISWAQIDGINFNSPTAMMIMQPVSSVNTNSNLAIPLFNDFSLVVDANNKLHIGATYKSTYSSHDDSLNYAQDFTVSVNPDEVYSWLHGPGNRPYLYDFIGDGNSPWGYLTIDSIGTQSAGTFSDEPGYSENFWDSTVLGKSDNLDSRIQLARTPDGKYITFTWSESDTNATTSSLKYNNKPNIKARCLALGPTSNLYQLSYSEINVTKVALGQGTSNPNVTNRATLNYLSPITSSAAVINPLFNYSVEIYTPMTITNSNPYSQLTNNTIWYQSGKLVYIYGTESGNPYSSPTTITGIRENTQNLESNSVIFPNPTCNSANLSIDLKDNSILDISVLNTIGQTIKTQTSQGKIGKNNIPVDLIGLSNGIYLVTIKIGDAIITKKIVVQ